MTETVNDPAHKAVTAIDGPGSPSARLARLAELTGAELAGLHPPALMRRWTAGRRWRHQ